MTRGKTRVPAPRRNAQAGFALKPAILMLFLAITATFAPSCSGDHATTGKGAQTLQKLTAPEQAAIASNSKTFAVLDLEEPLVTTASTTDAEDAAIHTAADTFQALAAMPKADESDNLAPFEQFVQAYPQSGWTSGVYLNLGLRYYHTGHLSKAITAFQNAWELGKAATDWKAKLPVDRAFGELVRMHARIGHAPELEALFAELGDRPISGSATEMVAGAREGMTVMHTRPEVAYLCGPAALGNVMLALGSAPSALDPIKAAQSGPHGFTLAEVASLADQVGLSYRLIYRAPGQAVPVPSVMNWNVHHFGAIVAEQDGRYVMRDPTFGYHGGMEVPEAAIDAEASGFFLVPSNIAQDAGWRDATSDEAQAVYGMGVITANNPGAYTPVDTETGQGGATLTAYGALPTEHPMEPKCKGMCVPDAHVMNVSLNINDTPVGHASPVGPSVFVTLTYNQRETAQPATFTYFNVSPKWTINALAYVQDNPTSAGSTVTRYYAGGGFYDLPGWDGSTGQFYRDQNTGAQLVRTPASGTLSYYTLNNTDGSVYTYSQLDGATSFPRRVFLTSIADPQGNSLTYSYSTVSGSSCPGGSCTILSSITDAAGRSTTFTYGVSGQPLLISAITDPFGRSATITYDSSARLSTITDVLGIVSTMGYDSGGLVNSLQTPYGTTSFAYGQTFGSGGNVISRYLETTDPDSHTERLEYYHGASGVPSSESSTPCCVSLANYDLQYQDSFFWDKYSYPTYGTGSGKDYTKARIWHFTHEAYSWINYETSPMVQSTKEPLEDRVWYTSYGQYNGPAYDGALYTVTYTARVNDAAATQITHSTRNALGKVTDYGDSANNAANGWLCRHTTYTYASNNIDVTQVQQLATSAPSYATLAQYTYNSQHEPLTYTDAAGKVSRYCYNSLGQLTQAIDPANYVSGSSCGSYGSVGTRYTYESSAPYRLTSITNAAGNTQATFTYPSTCGGSSHVNCDIPSSITDSEGRSVSYAYDALDRVTTTTYPDSTTDVDDWKFQSGTYSGTQSLEVRKHTDRLGRNTVYAFDAERRLTQVTDPNSQTVQYAYFANGALNTLTDQNGHTTTWAIDIQSRPTSKTFADGKTISYAYTSNEGLLSTVTDATSPTAQVKTYAYGNNDRRVTGITYTHAVNTTSNLTFAWDLYYPRLTSMTDGNGTTSYSYVSPGTNGALKLLTEDGPYSNDAMTWAYDADDRPNSLTVGGLSAETWSYDALSRATSHVTSQGTWTYAFNGQTGAPTSRTLGSTGISTTWSYATNTNDRRLTGITNAATGASPGPRSFTYGYTASGSTNPYDILSSTDSSGGHGSWSSQNWTYTYSNLDRLTNATGSGVGAYSYAYDYSGNPTTWTATGGGSTSSPTYSNVNELTSGSYTYDLVGEETADGTRTFKYDAENRPVEIDYTGTTHKTNITYDGIGRRTVVAYYNGSSTTTRRYAWCGSFPCEERDGSDTILRRFYPEGEYTISGTVKLVYMPDQVGSVRDVVNVSGPSVDYSQDFTPYGGVANSSGSTAPFFGFAGMVYDPNSSLNYSATRFYDPAQGRWIHRDFIAENGGLDLFSYAGGNPINKADPSGLCPPNEGRDWSKILWNAFGPSNPGTQGLLFLIPGAGMDLLAGRLAGEAGALTGSTSSALDALNLSKQLAFDSGTAQIEAGLGEVIAGAGSKRAIDDLPRLLAEYGREASDWTKITSEAYDASDGIQIAVHAYRNVRTGQVIEAKAVFPKGFYKGSVPKQ